MLAPLMEYDETILLRFAARLYRRAYWTIGLWTCGMAIVLSISSIALDFFALQTGSMWMFLPGFLVGAVAGYLIGESKAFNLKLRAQQVLCQAKIERNTRAMEPVSGKDGVLAH